MRGLRHAAIWASLSLTLFACASTEEDDAAKTSQAYTDCANALRQLATHGYTAEDPKGVLVGTLQLYGSDTTPPNVTRNADGTYALSWFGSADPIGYAYKVEVDASCNVKRATPTSCRAKLAARASAEAARFGIGLTSGAKTSAMVSPMDPNDPLGRRREGPYDPGVVAGQDRYVVAIMRERPNYMPLGAASFFAVVDKGGGSECNVKTFVTVYPREDGLTCASGADCCSGYCNVDRGVGSCHAKPGKASGASCRQ